MSSDSESPERQRHPQPQPRRPDPSSRTRHRRILLTLSCAATLFTLFLTLAASQFPLFDASPNVLLPPPPSGGRLSLRHALASAVLRWDAFHFAHIATDGYVYEHEWAFFSATPLAMRLAGRLLGLLSRSESGASPCSELETVLLGGLVAAALTSLSVLTLYDLSLEHLGSHDAAFLAALLSLLPSSPVTLRIAGYTEPFFTTFSYRGMLDCIRGNWLFAAVSFSIAGAFRSNGIFLSGFLLWGMLVEPLLQRRKVHFSHVLRASALSTLTVLPFLHHQYSAYRLFCTHAPDPASWCSAFPPFIYTYVQSKYWNVGFLRYWTLQQLPNFILGASPLILLFSFAWHYLRHALFRSLRDLVLGSSRVSINKNEASPEPDPKPRAVHAGTDSPRTRPLPDSSIPSSPFLRPSIAPHAIHALLMSLLLLLASHTQIVLRLAASMPFTYWAAAWLLVERPQAGKLWVGWSVVWGAVSCVLWGVFLPPA